MLLIKIEGTPVYDCTYMYSRGYGDKAPVMILVSIFFTPPLKQYPKNAPVSQFNLFLKC